MLYWNGTIWPSNCMNRLHLPQLNHPKSKDLPFSPPFRSILCSNYRQFQHSELHNLPSRHPTPTLWPANRPVMAPFPSSRCCRRTIPGDPAKNQTRLGSFRESCCSAGTNELSSFISTAFRQNYCPTYGKPTCVFNVSKLCWKRPVQVIAVKIEACWCAARCESTIDGFKRERNLHRSVNLPSSEGKLPSREFLLN